MNDIIIFTSCINIFYVYLPRVLKVSSLILLNGWGLLLMPRFTIVWLSSPACIISWYRSRLMSEPENKYSLFRISSKITPTKLDMQNLFKGQGRAWHASQQLVGPASILEAVRSPASTASYFITFPEPSRLSSGPTTAWLRLAPGNMALNSASLYLTTLNNSNVSKEMWNRKKML